LIVVLVMEVSEEKLNDFVSMVDESIVSIERLIGFMDRFPVQDRYGVIAMTTVLVNKLPISDDDLVTMGVIATVLLREERLRRDAEANSSLASE
jgi:hypothetical protein